MFNTSVQKTRSLREFLDEYRDNNVGRLPYLHTLEEAGFNSFRFENHVLYTEVQKWCEANLQPHEFKCFSYLTYYAIAFDDDASMVCIKLIFGNQFDKRNGET